MAQVAHLKLEEIVNIAHADNLLKEFRELYVLGQSVELDASKVERIDTSGLQLIVSLHKSLAANQLNLTLKNASAAFRKAVTTSGLQKIIMID